MVSQSHPALHQDDCSDLREGNGTVMATVSELETRGPCRSGRIDNLGLLVKVRMGAGERLGSDEVSLNCEDTE